MTFILNMASGEVEVRNELPRCSQPAEKTSSPDAGQHAHAAGLQLMTAHDAAPSTATAGFDLTALIDSLRD
jgi:hypothetical protein